MKFLGALAFTWMAGLAAATPATAEFIDFTGLGTNDGDAVYTDDAFPAGFVDFDVRDSFGNGGGSSSDFVLYRATPDFSGSAALYAPAATDWFQLILTPHAGNTITSISFDLGGQPDSDRTAHYGIFNNAFALLDEDDASISGTTGGLVSLGAINLGSIVFQFSGTGVGIRSVSFTTAAAAVTPIPGALLLFGTGLAGLGLIARRKRAG